MNLLLQRAAVKIDGLEKRITALSGNIRDAQATRFNYIILTGLVAVTITMMCALGWIAIQSQDVNETNKWFYNEYKNSRQLSTRYHLPSKSVLSLSQRVSKNTVVTAWPFWIYLYY
nr:hypothetical protein pPsy0479a_00123 [Pseudomonas syringae]